MRSGIGFKPVGMRGYPRSSKSSAGIMPVIPDAIKNADTFSARVHLFQSVLKSLIVPCRFIPECRKVLCARLVKVL